MSSAKRRICCVPSCTNTSHSSRADLSFYMLPSAAAPAERREKWLQAIKRCGTDQNGSPDPSIPWVPPSKYYYVCSEHFVSMSKHDDPDHPDFTPSVFSHSSEGVQGRSARVERATRAKKRCAVRDDLPETRENGNLG